MQDSKYLEQLRQELVELSPDFAHDEKSIKNLIQHMLTHKIKVEQDNHFKDQLADRLSRHIAWSKESHDIDPKVQARTSRLGRFIAYGLPGLVLCFVIFYTLPWKQNQYELLLSPISQESSWSWGDTTWYILSTPDTNKILFSKTNQEPENLWSSSTVNDDILKYTSSDSTLKASAIIESSTDDILIAKDVSSWLSSTKLLSSYWDDWVWNLSWWHKLSSPTLPLWKDFVWSLEKHLQIDISLKEDTLLDCNFSLESLHCAILRNRPTTIQHKIEFLEEIQRILDLHNKHSDYLFQLLQNLKSS